MQSVRLPAGLVDQAAFRSALDRELDNPPRLLPTAIVAEAMAERRDDVAEWVFGQTAGEFSVTPEQTVAASKARHGIRPVAVWDLPSRLLYGALVDRLASSLPDVVRSSEVWTQFRRMPIAENPSYVVSADLASCYSLIDHGLLADELHLQSGDHQTVSVLCSLLREAGGREYGLPQQSYASDILAEAFLDRLERAIRRRGVVFWRYNDDFRINCASWSDVVRSLEILDEEARKLGLILNDSKTFTWKRETYEEHLDAAEALRAEIAAEAELDLQWYTAAGYGGADEAVEPDPDDVEVLTSSRLLDRWQEIAGGGEIAEDRKAEHLAILQLLPTALAKLAPEPGELETTFDTAMAMLRFEQPLTPAICAYLSSRRESTDELLASFDRFLASDPYLTGWQTWWLQQPLGMLADFATASGGDVRLDWVRRAFSSADSSPLLRANAAVTLARHGAIDEAALLSAYDRSTPVVRPTVVAALALLGTSPSIRRAIESDSRLHGWVYEWADEQNA